MINKLGIASERWFYRLKEFRIVYRHIVHEECKNLG